MINRLLKKGILLLLVAAMLLPAASVEALQSRISKFSDHYTITGYGAQDMLSIAMAQLGKTGKQLGYTEEWCCNFISDCAILAGQEAAIPAYGYCYGLYNAVLQAGGKKTTSSPEPGDLCFINWDGGRSLQHVEIVYKVENGLVYTIGGNSGGESNFYKRCVYQHDPLQSKFIVAIVRPAYQVLDTSYVTKCKSYDTYCTIRIDADTNVMTQPCTADTDSESAVSKTFSAGTELTAVAVIANTVGQYWYAVNDGGNTVYINACDTGFVGGIESILSISGVSQPEKLTEGQAFSVKGTIKAKHLLLSSVYAYVQSDGENLIGGTESVKQSSYALRSGTLNRDLKFGKLKPGEYIYVIGGSATGYYVDEAQTLQKFTVTVQLHSNNFVVVEHVCSWKLTGYADKHPHVAKYKCTGCGQTKNVKNETTTKEDCDTCNPEPESNTAIQLPEDHKLCQTAFFHPFFVNCEICNQKGNN